MALLTMPSIHNHQCRKVSKGLRHQITVSMVRYKSTRVDVSEYRICSSILSSAGSSPDGTLQTSNGPVSCFLLFAMRLSWDTFSSSSGNEVGWLLPHIPGDAIKRLSVALATELTQLDSVKHVLVSLRKIVKMKPPLPPSEDLNILKRDFNPTTKHHCLSRSCGDAGFLKSCNASRTGFILQGYPALAGVLCSGVSYSCWDYTDKNGIRASVKSLSTMNEQGERTDELETPFAPLRLYASYTLPIPFVRLSQARHEVSDDERFQAVSELETRRSPSTPAYFLKPHHLQDPRRAWKGEDSDKPGLVRVTGW
ncbi:hypothetical protein EDD18DRAFT_1110103 [Armillaria luteobubalina]|uniref:Uncharacterized protein n=1 Tax=Armillaria luteobubalina TaxID=153913 RepID=A0AA39PSH9_9AGAR|nr:hypothetical protein EDD18DRAFT_1110103 [Armillaria luteobubalina]